MAKEVITKIKLQVTGGQATPAPPVGPALGQHGVNIGQFVSQFNDSTKNMQGTILPVEISVYKDKSFSFVVKSPPASVLLKQAAGIAKGSCSPDVDIVGKVTWEQVLKIAKEKLGDMNASSVERAACSIAGTARSIGIDVVR